MVLGGVSFNIISLRSGIYRFNQNSTYSVHVDGRVWWRRVWGFPASTMSAAYMYESSDHGTTNIRYLINKLFTKPRTLSHGMHGMGEKYTLKNKAKAVHVLCGWVYILH